MMQFRQSTMPSRALRAILAGSLLCIPAASSVMAQGIGVLERPAFRLGSGPLVLYDTAHWNPPLTDGRYAAVAELLRADGYRIVPSRLSFEPSELAKYQLLLVVTPYAANPRADASAASAPVFSESESDALDAWVRSGGRLLLVVGHQPSGAAHANVARRFAVDLRNGVAHDSTPGNNWVDGHPACRGCLKFTRENGLLGSHPVISGRDSTEQVHSVISAAG